MIVDHVILKASEQIGAHSQGTWELSYIIQGHGNRTIGDKTESFAEGDMVLIVPDMPHRWSFESEDTIENITVIFDDDFITTCFQHIPELKSVRDYFTSLDESLVIGADTKDAIIPLLHAMPDEGDAERTLTLMRILLLISKATKVNSAGRFACKESKEALLNKARIYVRCNYNKHFHLKDIALHLGMSETGFCNFWKQMTGGRFWDYLTEQRIAAACDLLKAGGHSVSFVCYASGFNDLAYFCRTFKRLKGVTPSEYRGRLSK